MKFSKTTRKIFFGQIHGQFLKKSTPVGMGIDLTRGCNHGCVFCYQDCQKSSVPAREMSKEQVFSIVAQAKEMGICHIQFSGGEPFFRKDFFEILECVKRNGFLSTVFTNGSLISESCAARLALLQPLDLDIPFYAMDPVIFDTMTGTKNSFGAVKSALFFLKAQGIPVKLKMLVTRHNLGEVSKVRDFARGMRFSLRIDTKMSPGEKSGAAPYKLSLSPKEDRWLRERFPDHCIKVSHASFKKGVARESGIKPFSCCTGSMFFNVDPFGKMGFCGMIGSPGIEVIKNGLPRSYQLLKKELARMSGVSRFSCQKCPYIAYCDWCPADSYRHYKNFTSCVPYLKRRAKHRFQTMKKEHASQDC